MLTKATVKMAMTNSFMIPSLSRNVGFEKVKKADGARVCDPQHARLRKIHLVARLASNPLRVTDPRSDSHLQRRFHDRQQFALFGFDATIARHNVVQKFLDLPQLFLGRKALCQLGGIFARCGRSCGMAADAGYRSIVMFVAIVLVRKSHCGQQSFDSLIFHRGETAVRIHRQRRKVQQRLSLPLVEVFHVHIGPVQAP